MNLPVAQPYLLHLPLGPFFICLIFRSDLSWTQKLFPNQACLWGSYNPEKISVRVPREGGSPKDFGTKILVPIVNLVVNLIENLIVNLIVNFGANTLSSKRLDARRHHVILEKALDGIWPVGHACAVLR